MRDRPRILVVTGAFTPGLSSGPSNVVFSYCKELVKRGYAIAVYTTNRFSKDKTIKSFYSEIEGIKVYYFKNFSNKLAWKYKRYLPIGMKSCIKRNITNFNLVIIVETRHTSALLSYYYCRKYNVPYIFTALGSLPRRSEGIKTTYDRFFVYPMIRNAGALLAQTEHEKDVYKQFKATDEKIVLLPLPIDVSKYCNLPPSGAFRHKYRIPDNRKLLVFLGRFHESKGFDYLLILFANCYRKDKHLMLVIAGRDDGYLQGIKRLVADFQLEESVLLIKEGLYGEDKINAYIDADMFIITSKIFEETSMASLEACACFTPVAVSEKISIPYIEKYNAGIILKYNINDDMDNILRVAGDKSVSNLMGKNARRMIEEKFDIYTVVNRLETVINSICLKGGE